MNLLIGILLIVVGGAFCAAGFRYFLILLPLWGFLVGFNVGTDALEVLFGYGALATVLSWVMGFIVGVAFAVFSYFFYWGAVAILAGGLGYVVAGSIVGFFGIDQFGFLAFVAGIGLGVVFAVATLLLNVPKYLVILITAFGGAAAVIGGLLVMFGQIPPERLHWVTIGSFINSSIIWLFVFFLVGGAGVGNQLKGPEIGPDRYQMDKTYYRFGQ